MVEPDQHPGCLCLSYCTHILLPAVSRSKLRDRGKAASLPSLGWAYVRFCRVEDEVFSLCLSEEDFRGRRQEVPKVEEVLREAQ